jgi:predicted nucleic acid-binding protein
MPVLVDTNILIDCLRRSMKAMEWFKAQSERPFISAVSLLELYAGARSQREQRDIAELRKLVQCLPVVEQIGERSGVFMRLYGASHSIDIPDAIIAATAEHHGLGLATLNTKHFPMFPRLKPPY